jgi:hypothetical protein
MAELATTTPPVAAGPERDALLATKLHVPVLRPVAWLALDEGDNDPARFWRHAGAALDTVHPGVAEQVVWVLDDYHLIQAPAVHASLVFLPTWPSTPTPRPCGPRVGSAQPPTRPGPPDASRSGSEGVALTGTTAAVR